MIFYYNFNGARDIFCSSVIHWKFEISSLESNHTKNRVRPLLRTMKYRTNNLSLVCLYLSLYISFLSFGHFFLFFFCHICPNNKKEIYNYVNIHIFVLKYLVQIQIIQNQFKISEGGKWNSHQMPCVYSSRMVKNYRLNTT
jgi:hypothetical protein